MKIVKSIFLFILNVIKKIIQLILDACFLVLFVYGVTFIPYVLGYKSIAVFSNDTYSNGTLIYYGKAKLEELRVTDRLLQKTESEYTIYTVNDLVDDTIDVGDKGKIKYNDKLFKIAPISVPYLGYYVHFMNNNIKLVYILLGVIAFDLIFGGIRIRTNKRRLQ